MPRLQSRGATITEAKSCITALDEYISESGGDASATANDRTSISIEYGRTQANHVNLSQFNVTQDTDRAHKLVYSVIYGRPLGAAGMGRNDGRVDLSVNYEDISNDPDNKDRFVGSLTYTQKISETMTIPVSLIYANHSQFLSNVNRKLNVHFGLSYKLPDFAGSK